MMCSFAATILISIFVWAHANEVWVSRMGNMPDSVDNLLEHLVDAVAENLFDRVLLASDLHYADLDNTALGMSGSLATPTSRLSLPSTIRSPLFHRSGLSPRSRLAESLVTAQAARAAPKAPVLEKSSEGAAWSRRAMTTALSAAMMPIMPLSAFAYDKNVDSRGRIRQSANPIEDQKDPFAKLGNVEDLYKKKGLSVQSQGNGTAIPR